MRVNNINLISAAVVSAGFCFKGYILKTGPYFSLLMLLLGLMSPLMAQADGLFDFQMTLARKGNAEAQFKVGEMYETGFGVKQDMQQAEDWITSAAQQGHETAGFKLLYWDVEKNGLKSSNQAKFDELNQKAKAGNAQAQYFVGKMYAHGVGVKKDTETAIGWLNKATLVGVLAAERELAVVKEEQQRAVLAQRREQEKQAELQQREKQLQLERQQKAKARAESAARRQRASATATTQKAAEEAAARKAAEAAARKAAERKQRQAQQQALLEQRQVKSPQRKQQFEADPCSGKSARFLSTCK